jgi:hypothetical protein
MNTSRDTGGQHRDEREIYTSDEYRERTSEQVGERKEKRILIKSSFVDENKYSFNCI